jgi:exopolyphosphatase/guanosine-5'-triphosphate,3'-diphosphate pyrophosphatase
VEFTDGICVEFAEKNKITHTKHIFTNDIISSAMYYASRYNINISHVNKISDYCAEIFKALSTKFGLSKSDLILLKVAAIYANTGRYINVNDYNLYSYSIKKSNMLLGLSKRDNDIISFVVLFQKGIFDNEEYKYMTKSRKLQISKLSSILSLALSLDFEYRQKINNIRVLLKNGEMIITAFSDEDVTMEQWQFDENEKFFEEVFGIKAILRIKNTSERS